MRSRRTLGILLLLVSPYLLFVAAGLISKTVQRFVPGEVYETPDESTIEFYVQQTNNTFNGDCIQLRWEVEGESVREVFIADAPVTGTGERQHCDGTPPRIRIVFWDGTSQEWTVPVHAVFHDPATAIKAWLMFVPFLISAVAGVSLSRIYRWQLLQRPVVQYSLAFLFAIAWVVVLDLFTNSLNIYRYVWDHYHYIDMAENGIMGNLGLVAPYAYRPIPPLLAGFIGEYAGRSVIAGFRVVTYMGMISQLVLVFALARQFTRKAWVAWAVMLVIGMSTYNVKFLLFDIYRPDSLAYSVILVGMLALVGRTRPLIPHPSPLAKRRKRGEGENKPLSPLAWERGTMRSVGGEGTEAQRTAPLQNPLIFDAVILATAALGLLVREFCAIPAALLAFRLLRDFMQSRRARYLVEMGIVVAVVAAAYWLPRQIIPVGRTTQLIDVTEGGILGIIFNLTHDSNVILGILIYLLPVLVLLTWERIRRLWARLEGIRADLILYSLIVLVLTLIGGTDIARFVAYLFVPLVILLTILLDEGIHVADVIYLLAATAIYSRILAPVPQESLDAYLDYYIVWDNRISGYTLLRGVELLGWIAGAAVVRWGLAKKDLNRKGAKSAKEKSEKA